MFIRSSFWRPQASLAAQTASLGRAVSRFCRACPLSWRASSPQPSSARLRISFSPGPLVLSCATSPSLPACGTPVLWLSAAGFLSARTSLCEVALTEFCFQAFGGLSALSRLSSSKPSPLLTGVRLFCYAASSLRFLLAPVFSWPAPRCSLSVANLETFLPSYF